jgi:hypothetical protein
MSKTHAILFGVICGWHEALPEIAEKFGWSEDDIENIARLHRRFGKLCPAAARDD